MQPGTARGQDGGPHTAGDDERYRLLVDGVRDFAILMLDPAGLIVSWNQGAERIKGYTAPEVLGRSFSLFYTPEAVADRHPQRELAIAAREGRYEEEGWRVRKDGTRFWASVVLTALVDARGELSGFAKVTRDLTERRSAHEAESAANARAGAASHAKTDFLSRMSHELRTPLNAMLGFAELLSLDVLLPSQREAVEHIQRAGDLLLAQVEDLLDISRIESDRLRVTLTPVDVAALVAECGQLMAPMAAERGIEVTPPPSPPAVRYACVDAQRLKQIMLNLLANAVKYNRPEGTVSLDVDAVGDRVVIAVGDSGPGIDPAQIDRLFLPFERLGAEAGEVPGTGLGLTLSKRLAELMDGTITAESELGHGTVVRVSLPRAPAPAADAAGAPDAAAATGATGTVLYIEDNLANLHLVERILARVGTVELISAMQGRLGLELARTHRPDMVMLDLQLPDMPGEQVAAALRAGERTRDIPVVVLSGDADPERRRRLLEQGIAAYLSKPYKVADMIELVERTLARGAG